MNMDNEVIGVRTYQALKNLYLNVVEMQKNKIVQDLRKKDPLAFCKEYATIKICGPRQSGHSTAIAQFVNEFKGNWLVIGFNEQQKKYLFSKTIKISGTGPHIKVISNSQISFYKTFSDTSNDHNIYFSSVNKNSFGDSRINGIIVDCASFISKQKIEHIYVNGGFYMYDSPAMVFIFVE